MCLNISTIGAIVNALILSPQIQLVPQYSMARMAGCLYTILSFPALSPIKSWGPFMSPKKNVRTLFLSAEDDGCRLQSLGTKYRILCYFCRFSLSTLFLKKIFKFPLSPNFGLGQGYMNLYWKNFTSLLSLFFNYVPWLLLCH